MDFESDYLKKSSPINYRNSLNISKDSEDILKFEPKLSKSKAITNVDNHNLDHEIIVDTNFQEKENDEFELRESNDIIRGVEKRDDNNVEEFYLEDLY